MTVDPRVPNGVVAGPDQGNGISHGYITLNGNPPPPNPVWCDFLCRFTAGAGQQPNCSGYGPPGFEVTASRVGLDEVAVRFQVFAKLGCANPLTTPAINADLTVYLRQVCSNGQLDPLLMRFEGFMDAFPWHEFLLNGLLYRLVDPCLRLTDPNALLPPDDDIEVSLNWQDVP